MLHYLCPNIITAQTTRNIFCIISYNFTIQKIQLKKAQYFIFLISFCCSCSIYIKIKFYFRRNLHFGEYKTNYLLNLDDSPLSNFIKRESSIISNQEITSRDSWILLETFPRIILRYSFRTGFSFYRKHYL